MLIKQQITACGTQWVVLTGECAREASLAISDVIEQQ